MPKYSPLCLSFLFGSFQPICGSVSSQGWGNIIANRLALSVFCPSYCSNWVGVCVLNYIQVSASSIVGTRSVRIARWLQVIQVIIRCRLSSLKMTQDWSWARHSCALWVWESSLSHFHHFIAIWCGNVISQCQRQNLGWLGLSELSHGITLLIAYSILTLRHNHSPKRPLTLSSHLFDICAKIKITCSFMVDI